MTEVYCCAACAQPFEDFAETSEMVDGITWTRRTCLCGRCVFVGADRGALDLGVVR